MAVAFKDLKIENNVEVKTFTYNDNEIEVLQYLESEKKDNLLQVVIQNCDGTVIDTFAADLLFHLYLTIYYTNIDFSTDDMEDLYDLYDSLNNSGIIDAVVGLIPPTEYEDLRSNLLQMLDAYAVYRNSARGVIEQIGAFAPTAAQDIKEAMDELDMDKLDKVIEITKATNYSSPMISQA